MIIPEAFVARMGEVHGRAGEVWARLTEGFRYVAGEYGDPSTFERLASVLQECDRDLGTAGNRVYYLATVPDA